MTAPDDPEGALTLADDAARKTATAVLAHQGLRPTTSGGHIAIVEAMSAQFPAVGGLKSIDRLRRRTQAEYPDPRNHDTVTVEDAHDAVAVAEACLDAADRLIAAPLTTDTQTAGFSGSKCTFAPCRSRRRQRRRSSRHQTSSLRGATGTSRPDEGGPHRRPLSSLLRHPHGRLCRTAWHHHRARRRCASQAALRRRAAYGPLSLRPFDRVEGAGSTGVS